MNPQKALRQATATVVLPSAIFWAGMAILFGRNMAADEWPLWIVFFAVPLPLIYPIYRRYLKANSGIRETRYSRFSMLAYFAVSGLYMVTAFIPWRYWDSPFKLFLALIWFLLGIEYLRRSRKSHMESPR